jgi:hypothetical protein
LSAFETTCCAYPIKIVIGLISVGESASKF